VGLAWTENRFFTPTGWLARLKSTFYHFAEAAELRLPLLPVAPVVFLSVKKISLGATKNYFFHNL